MDGKPTVSAEMTDSEIIIDADNIIQIISNTALVKTALSLKPIFCSGKRKLTFRKNILNSIF